MGIVFYVALSPPDRLNAHWSGALFPTRIPRTADRWIMAAAEMPISVKLAPDEVRLMHDLSSVFWLPSGDFECWFSLTAAVTKHEDIFTAETQGHRIVKQEPEMLPAPFVVHFTGDGEDLVVFLLQAPLGNLVLLRRHRREGQGLRAPDEAERL